MPQVPSDAAAKVAAMQENSHPAPNPPLPKGSSFNPSPLGHGAQIFQFDAQRLRDDISVPTLVGVVASSKGAPLGSREFDVLTVLTRWLIDKPEEAARAARRDALAADVTFEKAEEAAEAARDAAIKDRYVETTMYKLVKKIYGAVSRERYEAVARAIDHLKAVTVTLPGFDARRGVFDTHALSKVNLISKVVITDHQRRLIEARDSEQNLASIAGSAKGKITLKVELDDWLCEAAHQRDGASLNFDVQRELAGLAKSLWVQLEGLVFTPSAENEDVEHLVLRMDQATFDGLGLHCARPSDNVRKVRQRLDSIIAKDKAYLGYQVLRDRKDARRVGAIVVERCTGDMRQQRLRDHERDRLLGEVAA